MQQIVSLEAERYLLAAVLNDRAVRVLAMGQIQPCFFSDAGFRAIYTAACALELGDKPVDPPSITEELNRKRAFDEVGSIEYIYEIAGLYVPSDSAERHLGSLIKAWAQRNLIDAMKKTLSSLEGAPADSMDELASHVAYIDGRLRSGMPETNELIDYRDCETETVEERGLLTGYPDLDKHIDIRPGMVFTIYGDSGHKKTTLAMNMVAKWAQMRKIAVYNYEQHQREVAKMVREAEWGDRIPRGNLWISPSPPPLELLPLQAKAIKMRKGLDGIVVDYLQTVTTTNPRLSEDENNFVRVAMRTLRDLARNNGLWVLVVAQMRKSTGDLPEHQENPSIDRMRGSGEIKMASSIILSTVLPSKLGLEKWNGLDTGRLLLVRIKKNRDCLTGDPGEERIVKLVHQLNSRLITSWIDEAGLPQDRLPY